MNPWPEWIHRFLWSTMIQTGLGSLILIQITPNERTQSACLPACDNARPSTSWLQLPWRVKPENWCSLQRALPFTSFAFLPSLIQMLWPIRPHSTADPIIKQHNNWYICRVVTMPVYQTHVWMVEPVSSQQVDSSHVTVQEVTLEATVQSTLMSVLHSLAKTMELALTRYWSSSLIRGVMNDS